MQLIQIPYLGKHIPIFKITRDTSKYNVHINHISSDLSDPDQSDRSMSV